MEQLLKELIQYGALGTIAGISIYQVYAMQRALFSLIRESTAAVVKNTEVMNELKATIKDCQYKHEYGVMK